MQSSPTERNYHCSGCATPGYANQWGCAIYRASHDDYQDSFLPVGSMGGTAEDALDTACGLYLSDATAGQPDPRRTNGDAH